MDAGGAQVVITAGDQSPAVYPRIELTTDGTLVAGVARGVSCNYFVGGTWDVLASSDAGATWAPTQDAELGLAWPASSTRERYDRALRVLPDGTWWTAGVVGWQARPAGEQQRARAQGRYVTPDSPPGHPGHIGVGTNLIFLQKSSDQGSTWTRREIALTAAGWTLGLPRDISLDDGTVVLPLRQRSRDGSHGQFLVARITPGEPDRVRLHAVPRDLDGTIGSEAAIAQIAPDRLIMLMRADETRGGDGTLLTSWSDDGGRTWSVPVSTCIWGRPPHLLRLADGRLLLTFGHQREPFGVMAVVSLDGGETWEVEHPILVAHDHEAEDRARTGKDAVIGYHPMTIQLGDGDLFTCYYARRGSTCDALGVRWQLTPP